MINFKNIYFSIGGVPLFENASGFVPTGHKVGVVGSNGAGKTTLFKLFLIEFILDAGVIEVPKNYKIGYVSQEAPSTEVTLLDTVLEADIERSKLLHNAQIEKDPNKIAEIYTRLSDINAYSAEARASSILNGLGFSKEDLVRPCSSFSGGWRMRVALASVLFSNPELLLLDEPTNYLDFEGSVWLENYLQKFKNTALVISHDRNLLNRSVTSILHLSQKKLIFYNGNYDFFDNERRVQLEQKISQKNKQDAQRAHLESFINRFKAKASKAKQAQSRIKILEKMKPIIIEENQKVPTFNFEKNTKFAPPLITIEQASVGYNNIPILKNINLSIDPDDRIALLGVNGEGKSTLSKLIAKKLNSMKGKLNYPKKLKIGYFAQHQLDELRSNETPFEHLYSKLDKEVPSKIRAKLGSVGFTQDTMDIEVKRLSGGQKARLLLLLVVIEKPDLLILDEPTNHLDVESREALIMALNDYTGSLILVTHDAFLVERLVDRLLIIKNGNVSEFLGDINEYKKVVLNNNTIKGKHKEVSSKNIVNNQSKTSSTKDLKKLLTNCENKISKYEKQKSILEDEMLLENFYEANNQKRIQEVNIELKTLINLITEEEKKWDELVVKIEKLN